ncbi:ATP-binding protein [Bauldia sp.]|uniref:ATP-binding protein n=1 Tax=Bauldia sp. TaxID=2575872 RepID=UPI003BAD1E77
MNGKTLAYLDLAALPPVGAVLLEPRPAFVFRGDGSEILWANAAAVAAFGAADMTGLLAYRLAPGGRTARTLSRLAKSLPLDRSRLEVLRFNLEVRQMAFPAACRGLALGRNARALLAVGPESGPRESLSTRAERLCDAIAGEDGLVAILDGDGAVLGASGGYDRLAAVSGEIDTLIDQATKDDGPVARAPLIVDGVARQAGVVGFGSGTDRAFLMIVGPPDVATSTASATIDRTSQVTETQAVSESNKPPEPAADSTAPARRFLWQTDRDHAFALVAPDLAEMVGIGNVPAIGETWRAVADRLGLDPEGEIHEVLSALSGFAERTVYWPLAVQPERVAVDLTGLPVFARDGTFEGYRGFGVIRSDDRRPDKRLDKRNDVKALSEDAGTTEPPAHDAAQPSNVVPLNNAPTRILPARLSGTEQDAFRRIAEALNASDAPATSATPPPTPTATSRDTPSDAPATRVSVATPFDTGLLDKLPVGIAIQREGATLFANQPLLEWLGYDSLDAFVAAGGVDGVFAEGADWPRTSTEDGLLKAVRRDGTELDVEAKLHAVTWDGATALMLSLVEIEGEDDWAEDGVDDDEPANDEPPPIDNTAAERARELEAILDTATDGVVVIATDGTIDGLNHTAEALFGVATDDVRGRPFTDLLAEESHKAAEDYLEGLATNGVASVLNDGREVIGRVPRGGLIPLFMTMGRVAGSGKYCAVLRDITHWKTVEEELIAARKAAEAASAQKSEFLAKISHEIRTPLNAIIGFSEVMMAERFGAIGNDRYRSYLRDIHLSGEHLMSLVNDLLDLSKVEAGKLDLDFASVAANEVIQECVALMQPQANRDRIIIRTSLAAGLPNVVADMRSLRQILLNVISNAVKFTKPGGQVIVATALEDDGAVVVRVRDTGIGMTAEEIETAMQPFRQVATSGIGEGTGLGLPLTKALVEANRAAFAIDSVPDQGTLVRITFPTTRVLAG